MPKKKKTSFAKKLIISLGVLVFLVFSGVGWHYYNLIFVKGNVTIEQGKTTFLYIPTGSDYSDVKQALLTNGFLKDEASFDWVAQLKKYPENVKAGRYKLTEGMTNNNLINLLRLSGNQTPVNLTFNSQTTLEELAGIVGNKLEADSSAFINMVKSDAFAEKWGFNDTTWSAFFIPNTYEFFWNTSAEEFVNRMNDEYKRFWSSSRIEKAKAKDLSPHQVVTLASIVEAETRKRDEMPQVAGLYLNRLERGMKLQADPTVKFAVGDPGLRRIYYKHLEVESPYNTYLNAGLPPGPISMPSTTAVDAVLNANDHNYIYMCARPDYSGYHNFAASHRQHLVNKRKYTAFLRREGIR
jgi:UPF0755 protein